MFAAELHGCVAWQGKDNPLRGMQYRCVGPVSEKGDCYKELLTEGLSFARDRPFKEKEYKGFVMDKDQTYKTPSRQER